MKKTFIMLTTIIVIFLLASCTNKFPNEAGYEFLVVFDPIIIDGSNIGPGDIFRVEKIDTYFDYQNPPYLNWLNHDIVISQALFDDNVLLFVLFIGIHAEHDFRRVEVDFWQEHPNYMDVSAVCYWDIANHPASGERAHFGILVRMRRDFFGETTRLMTPAIRFNDPSAWVLAS